MRPDALILSVFLFSLVLGSFLFVILFFFVSPFPFPFLLILLFLSFSSYPSLLILLFLSFSSYPSLLILLFLSLLILLVGDILRPLNLPFLIHLGSNSCIGATIRPNYFCFILFY
jgi:hypothetical protein